MIPDSEAEGIKQNFNQSGYDALLHIKIIFIRFIPVNKLAFLSKMKLKIN